LGQDGAGEKRMSDRMKRMEGASGRTVNTPDLGLPQEKGPADLFCWDPVLKSDFQCLYPYNLVIIACVYRRPTHVSHYTHYCIFTCTHTVIVCCCVEFLSFSSHLFSFFLFLFGVLGMDLMKAK
jgi:hypothetical protein